MTDTGGKTMRSAALRYLWVGLAILNLFMAPAAAQKLIDSYPAEKFAIAPGGVDLRTGRYAYSATDLSIGPKDGGITFTRMMPDYVGGHANPMGNFAHNWDIFVFERLLYYQESSDTTDKYQTTVRGGGRAYTFWGKEAGTGFVSKSSGPLSLLNMTSGSTKSSPTAIFTAQMGDGSVLVFRPMGGADCVGNAPGSTSRCAFVSEMTEANGTKYTFSYAYDAALPGNRARLKQVVSSRGYALLLEGSGSLVTKACVLNLAATTVPANGLCPAGVPTSSYTYSSGKLATATDANGAVSQFTYAAAPNGRTDMSFIKPGQTTPWLTNRIELVADEDWTNQEVTVQQTFADGSSYTYGYGMTPPTNNKPAPTIIGGGYTNAYGKTVSYAYGFPIQPGSAWEPYCYNPPCGFEPPDDFLNYVYQTTSGPAEIIDELGRTSTADYCDPLVMNGMDPHFIHRCAVIKDYTATHPDGSTSRVLFDGYGNVTKVTKNPQPGSALPPIVTEAAYANTNMKTLTKPLWVKDANGNVTDYTYDPAHGGVLTETGPAVNGIRPQKRYSYSQRYAWISNGSGGYIQAATPVWLLTSESFCRSSSWTGSACSVANDEVVTTYEYGPNSGPNNLLLRGTAVTADGETRRTCYTYDSLGRKISETSPKGTTSLTSCP